MGQREFLLQRTATTPPWALRFRSCIRCGRSSVAWEIVRSKESGLEGNKMGVQRSYCISASPLSTQTQDTDGVVTDGRKPHGGYSCLGRLSPRLAHRVLQR